MQIRKYKYKTTIFSWSGNMSGQTKNAETQNIKYNYANTQKQIQKYKYNLQQGWRHAMQN